MGSFNSAEICELLWLYLLYKLPEYIRKQVGLYRDDSLGIFCETPQQIERIKKYICNVLIDNGLKITIETTKIISNFLDVTLNLNKGTNEPYSKLNTLFYAQPSAIYH